LAELLKDTLKNEVFLVGSMKRGSVHITWLWKEELKIKEKV
jgi:hypothetical protein